MANPKRICTIPGCGKKCRSRGLCYMHDYYLKKYGDPFGGHTRAGQPGRWAADHVDYLEDECLVWPFGGTKGYGTITGPNGVPMHAARYMCILKYGPPPSPRHQAAHSCGKGSKGCVNPRHLRWATPIENSADMVEHRTRMQGEKHYAARLTEADVRDIRRLWVAGKTGREIGIMYGMHANQAGKIARGTAWKHVV